MTSTIADTAPIDVLESLLTQRHSCRAYKSEQVPRAIIARILGAAQRTASWCNSQPWQVVITSGEETEKFRDALYPVAASGVAAGGDFEFPREYRGVYQTRRRQSGFQLYDTLGIRRGDRAAYARQMLENFRFFGAPHVAIITSDEALGVYGAVDCGGYVGNFMLAAQALGIASVPQAALAMHSAVVRQHFGLGEDRRVVCGISFGFADTGHKINSYRTSRAPIDEVATFVGE
ncbi:MAG TPA: nitroreductase [Rhodopseudomonas sp.]|uniref:nitroreductase n=1 Tax=Rhodopseudomonas sp. TaxID=1078 RepID=UPI002ED7E3A2